MPRALLTFGEMADILLEALEEAEKNPEPSGKPPKEPAPRRPRGRAPPKGKKKPTKADGPTKASP
jgi:hypothetical protein